MTDIEKSQELKKMMQAVKRRGKKIAVFTHNNPDPDALAAAFGFKLIAAELGCGCEIFYGGEISHPQNQTLVKLFQIEPRRKDKFKPDVYGKIAYVDAASPEQANMEGVDLIPDIIIDHHTTEPNKKTEVCDIRPVGASCSIIVDYIKNLNLKLDKENEYHVRVATALHFGIINDTHEMTVNVHKLDWDALSFLSEYVDDALYKQVNKRYPRPEYFYEFEARAENNHVKCGTVLVAGLEYVSPKRRDVIPHVADHQLNREGTETVLVLGIVGNFLHASVRSKDVKLNTEEFLGNLFGEENSGAKLDGSSGAAEVSLGPLAPDDHNSEEAKSKFWQGYYSVIIEKVQRYAAMD